MSDTRLRLSICIPTFNRAKVLDECLRSVVPQCQEVDAEICVSDNASDDDTIRVLESWKQKYPNFRINRHVTNLRIDRNIVAAAALAKGDLIWFLSDDDVLELGAVKSVLEMVGANPSVPAFIVNRREYDATLTTPAHDTKQLTPSTSLNQQSKLSLERGLIELGEYLGYLPAWIIRREAWESMKPDTFLDTDFVHVGVGIAGSQIWAKQHGVEPSLVVSNIALVRCRLGRASWRNRHYEIWIRNWQTTLRGLAPYVAAAALKETAALVTQRNYLSIVSGRGFGPYGIADYRQNIRMYIPSGVKRTIAVLVAYAPRWSARVFTKVQRSVREAFAN